MSLSKNLTFLVIAVLFLCASSSYAYAQSSSSRDLISIELNKETNDPKALAIAKKLDPDFFEVDMDYTNGYNDAEYYARFMQFGDKLFLISTAQDSYFYCTKYGCPINFYENMGGNRWLNRMSFRGFKLSYDKNSKNKNYPNLLLEDYDRTRANGTKKNVFIWDGSRYKEISS